MKLFVGVLAMTSVLCCWGCTGGGSDGPKLVPATGTVYYNDKPIAGATVTFMVEKSPIATGITNAEGKFVLSTGGRPGAPLGEAKVGIAKAGAAAEDRKQMTPEDMAKMAQQQMQMRTPEPKPEIPLKYGNPETSNLVASLVADGAQNVFEFRLVD